MLELYNDKLLDLFVKGGNHDDKLDIKKDKKANEEILAAKIAAEEKLKVTEENEKELSM